MSGAAGAEIRLTNVPSPTVLENFYVCFLSFKFLFALLHNPINKGGRVEEINFFFYFFFFNLYVFVTHSAMSYRGHSLWNPLLRVKISLINLTVTEAAGARICLTIVYYKKINDVV